MGDFDREIREYQRARQRGGDAGRGEPRRSSRDDSYHAQQRRYNGKLHDGGGGGRGGEAPSSSWRGANYHRGHDQRERARGGDYGRSRNSGDGDGVSQSRGRKRTSSERVSPQQKRLKEDKSPEKEEEGEDEELANLLFGESEDEEEKAIAEQRKRRQQLLDKLKEKEKESVPATPENTLAAVGSTRKENLVLEKSVKSEVQISSTATSASGFRPDFEKNENASNISPKKKSVMPVIDMFGDSDDADEDNSKEERAGNSENIGLQPGTGNAAATGLADNWDDADGYYNIRVGEVMDGKYRVISSSGKGVFSSVVIAEDAHTGTKCAIKIIRNNPVMLKAGIKEMETLKLLRNADPKDRMHCLALVGHFYHKGHLCMVLEKLHMNLREILKMYGNKVGLSIEAVRTFAHQLFVSLKLLQRCRILHADIKPDNIMVNESNSYLKLCDFGSALSASDIALTSYVGSRYYRAPELILGMKYDTAIDMWAVGVTLFELFTGRVLFHGKTNNDMLKSIMEVKGKCSRKMIKKGQNANMLFDENNNFIGRHVDPITGQETIKLFPFHKPSKDLLNLLTAGATLDYTEMEQIRSLRDLLDKCLTLDPAKRISPDDALKHPFIASLSIVKN
eukprot:Nk52_evm27s223 gene=Nk52_evmTU27s223